MSKRNVSMPYPFSPFVATPDTRLFICRRKEFSSKPIRQLKRHVTNGIKRANTAGQNELLVHGRSSDF